VTRTETTTPSGVTRTPALADVAALAGVSPATVSRVINGSARVGHHIRSQVESAIDRLGHVRGRAVPHGRSIALVICEDDGRGKGFDRMCDPVHGGNALNGNSPSGALANARCPGTGSRPVPPVAAERLSGGVLTAHDGARTSTASPPSPCRRPSPPVPYAPEA
jgi:Bacterial regulatory proteins, lacI family